MSHIVKTSKKQKHYRIRDIDISECYSVGEVLGLLGSFNYDSPLVLKCGGKNFRICSDTEVNGVPVLIGAR